MSFRFRSVLALSVAVCALLLVAGGPASAASSPPKLSGTYALQIHRYCQPLFSGQMTGDLTDNDVSYTGFNDPGSTKDQIGIATFNASKGTVTGSMIKVGGTVVTQDLAALGAGTAGQQFTESAQSISGTFSTTDASFTVDTGDGSTTFDAVYGAFSGSTAHVVFFVNVSTGGNGISCEESGQLQFK
jgi:hypothetical protein